MKTLMQQYFIITMKKEEWSDRKIAAEYHISRNTIRKYWRRYLESEKELINHDSDHDTRIMIGWFDMTDIYSLYFWSFYINIEIPFLHDEIF